MAQSKPFNFDLFNGLALLALIFLGLATVIVGRPVLMPVGLAVLLTFILTPVVSALERLGIGRVTAVCTLGAIGICCLVALLSIAFTQANELVSNLPTYWEQTQTYVDSYVREKSFLSKLWQQVQTSIEPKVDLANQQSSDQPSILASGGSVSWLSSIPTMLGSLFAPLANTAAVVVLTIFMLIQREDIRNRFIGALGETRLINATRVMNDTSERLSSYLFGLCAVNFGFSVVLTIGLYFIGVPYALVWGIVSFFFRFIPYLGSTLSMLLPLLTSVVTQQSWVSAVCVIGLYVALEFTTGNFIEPNLFGNSVGMNPVALLIALMFWAWAWGTIGLVMAVPLTLIIVTLGKHLPCFESLEKLAGNSDPMPPHVIMYQRLISKDMEECHRILKREAKRKSLSHAIENTVMRTLELARAELRAERISPKDASELELNAKRLVADEIREDSTEEELVDKVEATEQQRGRGVAIALGPVSSTIGMLVAANCERSLDWTVVEVIDSTALTGAVRMEPEVILLAGAPPLGILPLLKLCKRLRRLGYSGKIVVGYWRRRPLTRQIKKLVRESGADYVSHRIWTVSRLLLHLDAIGDEPHGENPVQDTTSGLYSARLMQL